MIEAGEGLLGRVVISKTGRDKNRAFLVVGRTDSDHLLLADGCLRKWERPKKKKRKHVHLEPMIAENIRAQILEGAQVPDSEIRKSLVRLGYELNDLE